LKNPQKSKEPKEPKELKVTLVTCGYKNIQQTYQNIEHLIIEELLPPIAFQDGIQSSSGTLLCFLDSKSDFAFNHTLKKMVNVMLNYPQLGGIYTDQILNGVQQYYPSYSYQALQQHAINTPFLCYKTLDVKFNPNNLVNYYYEALKDIGQKSVLHHIPEPLFVINTTV